MSVNWAKFREEEFPALDKDLTFLDAACVSLIPQRTVRVMHEFIEYSARNDEINSSAHHINMDHKRDKAYTEAAKLLNADLEEIALVESTSHGLNVAGGKTGRKHTYHKFGIYSGCLAVVCQTRKRGNRDKGGKGKGQSFYRRRFCQSC